MIQQVKFSAWNFARKHPFLGSPIRRLGKWSTTRVQESYRKSLADLGDAIIPRDRYLRTEANLVQVSLAAPDGCDTRGIIQLLNHLRIPYRHLKNAVDIERNSSEFLIVCGEKKDSGIGRSRTIFVSRQECWGLLPWNDGLRSDLSVNLVEKIFNASKDAALVTGMLPALIGFRLDDVEGAGAEVYLPALLRRGWIPNLGVFLHGLEKSESDCLASISALARDGAVEVSPHALSADEFIFFDYARGRPFSHEEFMKRWNLVKKRFLSWNLPISESLNAHFHSTSEVALRMLSEEGVLWNFSELAPDGMSRKPNRNYFPTGDPTLTTGQIDNPIRHIYAGDTAQDCNQLHSYYDFLMGRTGVDDVERAADKIGHRLALSVRSGFPAFVTTHEYLLSPWSAQGIEPLFDRVEEDIEALSKFRPQKGSLTDVGRVCGDHTDTVIESVKKISPEKLLVELSGACSGNGFVTLLWQGKCHYIKMPRFLGTKAMEIEL